MRTLMVILVSRLSLTNHMKMSLVKASTPTRSFIWEGKSSAVFSIKP